MSDWPFLLDFARRHPGRPLALATLVGREGSSYRPPGARMIVAEGGEFSGSLSGGCLEEGIARTACRVIASGRVERMCIDTRPHFGCPGKLHVVVEPLEQELLETVAAAVRRRRPLRLATGERTTPGAGEAGDFVETVARPVRLIAVGWTADMEPVLRLARTLGWECHRLLRDMRMAGETPPVAGETVAVCAPDELLSLYPPDEATALLVMTHHLATDLGYLRHALTAGYGYLGLLGSRRRRETLLAELGGLGLLEDPAAIERFHAPVGLDLGANHPATIALSIVAEIQAALHGAGGGFLRDRLGAIHALSLS